MQNRDNNNMCSKIAMYIICLPNVSVTDDSFIQIIIFARSTKAGVSDMFVDLRFTSYVHYII